MIKRCNMDLPPTAKYLLDWFVRYVKNRDLAFRRIADVVEEGNKVIIKQKDGKYIHYYVEPFPDDLSALADSIKEEHCGIVMYNCEKNFSSMLSAWKKLSAMPGLTVYFINPFSKLDKRWIIRPHVHAKISDAESLEQGLRSMFVMVNPISEKEAEQLTN